ncbi:MAG TPA: hypothetical protein VFL95_02360 [Gemmatimonadales bacterium]|nr:hypothetical protein [Gemmatimonadales bacterium]
MSRAVIGWWLGQSTAAAARFAGNEPAAPDRDAARPIQPGGGTAELVSCITELARDVGSGPGASHAVVLGHDWSAGFATLGAAVSCALDGFAAALPGAPLYLLTVDGELAVPESVRTEPLRVAGACWAAAAALAAEVYPDALYVAVGPSRTELVSLSGGAIAAAGRTDAERLLAGELLPTGVHTSPVESLLGEVPLWDGTVAIIPGIAVMADVHVWRGALAPGSVTVDGRPLTHARAGQRLARAVGGDRDFIDETAVGLIAAALARAQVNRVRQAIERAIASQPGRTVLVTGPGAFVATEATRGLELDVIRWKGRPELLTPEAAVGWLLAQEPNE